MTDDDKHPNGQRSAAQAGDAVSDAPAKKKEGGGLGWLTVAGSVISLVAVMLALSGYGVALAVEDQFALPHSTVFDSVFDLTDLSSVVIAQMLIHGLPQSLTWDTVLLVWHQSSDLIVTAMAGWSLITLVLFIVDRWRKKGRPMKLPAMLRRKGPVPPWLRFFLLILIWPAMPFGIAAMIVLILTGTALLATAPMLGMFAAEGQFREYVVEPTACVPVRNREAMLKDFKKPPVVKNAGGRGGKEVSTKEHRVTCVVVVKDGKQLGKGRVVVSTSKALVLFDPVAGFADRVPTGDAVVRPIGSLDGSVP